MIGKLGYSVTNGAKQSIKLRVIGLHGWSVRMREISLSVTSLTRMQVIVIHQFWQSIQCQSKKCLPDFLLTLFPKRLGIFSANFTHLLHIPIYARLQIFIQLPPTATKLCHIKCDQHYMLKMSTIGWNARWVVAHTPCSKKTKPPNFWQ